MLGLIAVIPFLLAALIAAIAVVRRNRAAGPHTNNTFRFGCFMAGLLACGVVWAFYVYLVMAVGAA